MFSPPPFHPNRPHLVAPVRIDRRGETGPTRAQARGLAWRSVHHGWYVPSYVESTDPCQRIVEASVLLPRAGGVTGWAALCWLGGRWFDGLDLDGVTELPVALATAGLHARPHRGVRMSEERCEPDDLLVVDGLRVTTAVRSTCFAMRHAASDDSAACVLDMAAYNDLVSIDELAAYVGAHRGLTGIPRCRRAIPLADENSWSLRESLMRRVWERQAGFPRPLCNVPVFDRSGALIGTPDLLDPVAGLAGEYEGAVHLAGKQRATDVRREAMFRAAGLEYVAMLSADFTAVENFVTRLQEAYDRAPYAPADQRHWTIERPAWWIPTFTVAQRRALTPELRKRLLRHRLGA